MDTIIITGVNGQLGQFLTKYLQETQPALNIVGTIRHKSYDSQPYIFDKSKITFELMDLMDSCSINNLVVKYKPAYFVNTAANAFVGESWQVPVNHIEANTTGVLHQLEAIRKHAPLCHYFNSGTSEEFGNDVADGRYLTEASKIDPKSPYGVSKAAARYLVQVYRRSYDLYAVQNWTFNFESELRGEKYVTRKVTMGAARIAKAIQSDQLYEPIELGNLDSVRSWQFAGDVADSIWRSLNQDKAAMKDYVVSAPDCHTIRELVTTAFKYAGIKGQWLDDTFIESTTFDILAKTNPKYLRPVDVTYLNGDASLIKNELGWKSTLTFDALIKRMVEHDMNN